MSGATCVTGKSYHTHMPTPLSLRDLDAASHKVDGDGGDEHPHSRQRMHLQTTITSPCGQGID